MEMTYCSNCGTKISKKAKFCGNCGEKITLFEMQNNECPDCGYVANENEKYCPDCGTALALGKNKRFAKTTVTHPVKKKKKGFPRTLGKVVLWVFGILVLAIVSLYFIGDGENSTELEVDSNNNVEQSDQVDSDYENKYNSYKAIKEPESLKKVVDKMETVFKQGDTTKLKLLLTNTSLKTYTGVYSEIQPYMGEYAKAFKNRKLIKLNKIFALYSFEDGQGNNFTVEFTPIDKDSWKLTRF